MKTVQLAPDYDRYLDGVAIIDEALGLCRAAKRDREPIERFEVSLMVGRAVMRTTAKHTGKTEDETERMLAKVVPGADLGTLWSIPLVVLEAEGS